ncbi:DUF7526 family protein [Halorussus halophilus]|uniref:DUF7526 family protein n=1 Tax=Halorussus halophilus TaxID=2650975 RepID=UPI0013010209|nr:hypothetical protein [Halorussus halophilus]
MVETLRGEVLHVVGPDELDDHDLDGELRSLAESRYVLVCRKGGHPSPFERIKSFLLRDPIEPVTIVAETEANDGDEVIAEVEETGIAGVYEAVELR